ncbi:MAG: undecaprenyl/decaprenyl-phosphate alpha-N-acetylglucosaminyl 1-phosphate transferase [Candidatus Cloacimonetes bacterium]|nr:undecaprenyl/decaprenyl-phosphate alpha-N-acetylglucosaminyl 1-phosphate transferase [Candidatus Cloacimonadota bacterium]
MNYIYLIEFLSVFAGVFILTLLLIPISNKISHSIGIIDMPEERKVHKTAIASAGGLSFGLPIIVAQFIFSLIYPGSDYKNQVSALAVCGLWVLILGVIDDKFRVKAYTKLFYQIIISVFLYFAGFRIMEITNPFGPEFQLGFMSFPVTIFWYLIIINSINLIDGIDGLAAGIGSVSAIILFFVGVKYNNLYVMYLSLLIIAGCTAFLKENFYPAKIFMGDTGSMFIGVNLASIATVGTGQLKGITAITLMIPITVMALPLLDTILAVFRRVRKKRSIFTADKEHFHHILLNYGLSHRTISYIAYLFTLLFGLIALGFSFSSKKILLSVLVVLISVLLIILYTILKRESTK